MTSSISIKNSASTILLSSPYCSIKKLPDDLILYILNFLDPQDLSRVAHLSKEWKVVVMRAWKNVDITRLFFYHKRGLGGVLRNWFNIKKITSLNIQVIGPEQWRKSGAAKMLRINVESAPKLDIYRLTSLLFDLVKRVKVEGNRGFTVMLLPQGLTLNKILTFAWPSIKTSMSKTIGKELGKRQIKKTHWVIVANSIIEETRSKSFSEQKGLIESYGGEFPTVLSTVTPMILANKLFKSSFYLDQLKKSSSTTFSPTYIRCFEVQFPFLLPPHNQLIPPMNRMYKGDKMEPMLFQPIVVASLSPQELFIGGNPLRYWSIFGVDRRIDGCDFNGHNIGAGFSMLLNTCE